MACRRGCSGRQKSGDPIDTKKELARIAGAAADWIDANQLGRRNLMPDQASLMRGRRYNRAKGKQGGDHKSKDQNDTLIDHAERLAKQHGVSAATIKRDGKFAAAVEKVKAVDPEIEKKIVSGNAPSKAAKEISLDSLRVPCYPTNGCGTASRRAVKLSSNLAVGRQRMLTVPISRRTKLCVLACFLLPIVVFGGLGYWDKTSPALAAEANALPDLPPAPTPVNKVPCPVVSVIDGDTIVVRIDSETKTVRLIGVDTPETVHPRKEVQYYGKEASLFSKNLLKGEHVYLDFEGAVGTYDKYQRLLAYVFRAPDGLFVNLEIVRQGYGSAYTALPAEGYFLLLKRA